MISARPLLIFPCNGNGIEALDCIGADFVLLGFVDDEPGKRATRPHGIAVHGRDAFDRWPDAAVLAVPGSPTSFPRRRAIVDGLGLAASRFARVIHPDARISPLASIGHNVLIMAGVVITSDAVVGDHVCILPNTVVHHDVAIGDWCLIGSNVTVAGGVRIGANSYVGSGSSLRDGLRIGARALVGLGSVVVADVTDDSRVAGCPAREM